ncbi:hypothetical protein FOA52_004512 [Chlamydomonas sp. UWO 241]|nr:hypothetical protein FOA52_004512 [Chlamydomonas sp. UWO 241]
MPVSDSLCGVPCKRTRTSGSQNTPVQEHDSRKRQCLRPGIPAPIELLPIPGKLSPSNKPDDNDGHYAYDLGENLSSRYKILSKIGEGTFGRVLECWDRQQREYVAIKIVRNIDKYRHAAMIELEVLNTLESNDPEGSKNCVPLRDWFDYRGHVCMVFQRLGPSLFDFLRRNNYRPFPIDLVQQFSRQLLEAVDYMHELQLVHTDLKPENILLVSLESSRASSSGGAASCVPSSSAIKVIDFGSATFDDQYHSNIVSTRHYRAPEVILGLGWSYPCDMWSLGCILVELITGDAMFQTHENLEHLAMMEAVLEPIPVAIATRAAKTFPKYFAKGRLSWPDSAASKKSVKAVKRMTGLRQLLLEQGDATSWPHVDSLVDLVTGMLAYEPHQRTTARQALAHPFFAAELAPSAVVTSAAASAAVAAAATAAAAALGTSTSTAGSSAQTTAAQQSAAAAPGTVLWPGTSDPSAAPASHFTIGGGGGRVGEDGRSGGRGGDLTAVPTDGTSSGQETVTTTIDMTQWA